MRWICASLVLMATLAVTPAATAQDNEDAPTIRTTTTVANETPDGVGSIVGPKPGDGVAPDDAGDRGGIAQILTFWAIVTALIGIVLLIRRDMKKTGRRGPSTEAPAQ